MRRLIAIFLVLSGFLLYSRVLSFGFFWDDFTLLGPWTSENAVSFWTSNFDPRYLDNPLVEKSYYFEQMGAGMKFYKPMTYSSYVTDYFLWGYNPLGYHLTNLILHLLIVLVVYELFSILTNSRFIQSFIALLYLIHPFVVPNIAWIGMRSYLLGGLFSILAFRYFLSGHRLLMIFFFLCGLLSFEGSIVFAVIPLAYVVVFQEREKLRSSLVFVAIGLAFAG